MKLRTVLTGATIAATLLVGGGLAAVSSANAAGGTRAPSTVAPRPGAAAPAPPMSGDTLHNGVVTEVLPQGHYRVATNTSLVLCELSNGMKKNRQQVHQGTTVVVKVSGIDPSRGTIIRRIKD